MSPPKTALIIALVIFIPLNAIAICSGDFENDGDVDGSNLLDLIKGRRGIVTSFFAADFGRADCPPLPAAPINQFTIGDSIGVGMAADNTPFEEHPEAVWSTGYAGDTVYSLNARFENADPAGYFENDAAWTDVFNQSVSGTVMADFETMAIAVTDEIAANPLPEAGAVSILMGSNDVCSALNTDSMTDPLVLEQFKLEFRNGLDVLANSPATQNAFIHVSSLPAIYWLWNAKRDNFWCLFIAWPKVPCEILLQNPINDCNPENSHLDPDHIYSGDGPNCIRRKEFHAAIRDHYNRIIADVLLEYKTDGRLPNAYYVDIFDVIFTSDHVNNGDCFHPSIEGHGFLAEEEWCRSPWGAADGSCGHPDLINTFGFQP